MPRRVLLLAGGAASGKTRAIGDQALADFSLIFDSNLAVEAKATALIDLALANGFLLTVAYTHRPYELALRGMTHRAMGDGRYVCIGYPSRLACLHFDAQQTIVKLRRAFPPDLVSIVLFENLWSLVQNVELP